MNWDAIGALSELLGAVGVIITLVFLARQIHQNTRSIRAATNHSLSQERNAVNLSLGLDSSAAELLFRGLQDLEKLEVHDRLRYWLLIRAVLGTYEDTYVQFREGMCDAETWELATAAMRRIASTRGFAAWWKRDQEVFRSEFRSEVEAIIRAAQQVVEPDVE